MKFPKQTSGISSNRSWLIGNVFHNQRIKDSSENRKVMRVDSIHFEELEILYNHHHHIVLAARISLTLSRHSSLSFIALGRSSGQQPVSSHSCWMYVRAGRPAFARPCVEIHKSTSLMSSSLLLQSWQQHPARHQLYGHLPPITKTIQVRRTRQLYNNMLKFKEYVYIWGGFPVMSWLTSRTITS